MNDESTDAAIAALPELTQERIDEIEAAVFDRIGRSRHARARSRRRGWILGACAAAAVVLVLAITPVVGGFVRSGSGAAVDGSAVAPASGSAFDATENGTSGAASGGSDAVAPAQAREIITTASATVRVDDVSDAIAAISSQAQVRGGYVESMSIDGTDATPVPVDGSYPPVAVGGGFITVRVPAADLQDLVDQLAGVGEVAASGISRQDVTSQSIDLQARIDAAQASVTRLTELMSQAGSVGDLIAAESALSDRQATLESYQQQLKALDDQVALSSLTVSVQPRTTAVVADPAGFGDGLAAGWNGLVATLNGIVVGIGFLLPWIAVVAVAALIVWGVVRLIRRRRRPGPDAA